MQAEQKLQASRIKEAFNYLKSPEFPEEIHTQADVGKKLGADKSTISKFLSATPRYYTANKISVFNAAFGGVFNETYLLGGEGTLLNKEKVSISRNDEYSNDMGLFTESKKVPQMEEAVNYLRSKLLIIKQQDIAAAMQTNKSVVSSMIAGHPKYYNKNRIASFNSAFGGIFNEGYLLGGGGTLLKEQPEEPRNRIENEVTPVPEENYIMVEYADLRASAGRLGGGDIAQLPETHKRLLPREYEKGNYLVVRVDGDSMDDGTKRSLVDGDEVLIREITEQLREGLPIKKSLFVITTKEGNVLKQIVEINREDEYIVCRSFNERYHDYKIPFEGICQIFLVCKKVSSQVTLA